MSEHTSWLAPMAMALLLAGGGSALAGCGNDQPVTSAPATRAVQSTAGAPPTTAPAALPVTPSPSAQVALTMSPDPASPDDQLEVTVQNHSSEPWSWDCAVGRLYRWSGQEWQEWRELTDVSWNESILSLSQGRIVLDCEPRRFIEPGSTEVRHVDLSATRRQIVEEIGGESDRPEPLPAGHYWLGFSGYGSSEPAEAEAAGTFEIQS